MRIVCGLLLAALLFSVAVHNEEVDALLASAWQKLYVSVGSPAFLKALLQPGQLGQMTNQPRSLLVAGSYSALYAGLSLALICTLLPHNRQRRISVVFYVCALVVGVLLAVAAKLTGGTVWLYQLSNQAIHFIVSPLPVIVLVPLLRWYLPAPPATTEL